MKPERCDIVIVGSGFAGSILARILASRGREVMLVERGIHPRFALGESSTPLASLSLERLATTYGLDDLGALAAYGRWGRELPQLRRGLKRGFTFCQHRPGRPYENGQANDSRLLVAASPDDEIADAHWLRSDVDAFLVKKAVEAGVAYRPGTRLDAFSEEDGAVLASGEGPEGAVALRARFLVDATGGEGYIARALEIPFVRLEAAPTRLVFGHFEGVPDFAPLAREGGAHLDPGPYPDDRAAVHHLLEEGWLYALPFDPDPSGEGHSEVRRVSAGLLTRGGGPPLPGEADAAWEEVLRRYPSLEACFGAARPTQPVTQVADLAYQRAAASGEHWLLLPHAYAFFDPLFSTGIAWSLVAVERVAQMLLASREAVPGRGDLKRYEDLLRREAAQIHDLVEGAYLAMGSGGSFERFAAVAALYFAAVSFRELAQRLLDPPAAGWAWEGFLGATDPVSRAFVHEARRRLTGGQESDAFTAWARSAIASRNAIGLADPRRRNLYPVDLEVLLDNSHLFGLSRPEMESRLPRLRGRGVVGIG
ncbi:MAG: FAD-dependent monooxygenase [Acidobacteria bacterium]|nr:FAD-dependent monooxygenase [Acidobacteriota bacterium]